MIYLTQSQHSTFENMLYLYLRRVQFYYYDNMTSHLFELSSFHPY